jgi:gamma-glutamyltranspeptidase/glutathione hydrolase
MVASIHPIASEIGINVLRSGGNAIDAAVATSAAMGVVAPQYSGLGGGGFILIHLPGTHETIAIDCREVAPKKADANMFKRAPNLRSSRPLGAGEVEESANRIGYKAVAVPGNLAGLSVVLEKYGTRPIEELLEPAIKLAENGYRVSRRLAEILRDNIDDSLTKARLFPATGKIYLKDAAGYRIGDKITNKDLAGTLRMIASGGLDVFYKGEIAELIDSDMTKHGGLVTSTDLRDYRAMIREPVAGTYRGYDIFTMSPPSGGGVAIVEILNILEEFDLKRLRHNSAEAIHVIAEAMSQAFADKAKHIADPDFVPLDYQRLLSKQYALGVAKDIATKRRSSDAMRPGSANKGGTVHFSIMDTEKNVVAMTESIECYFGSGVVVEGTGFLLNDQMHDFNLGLGGINSIEPGKRPSSNMAPTILLKDGRPFLAVGGSGGPRIVSSILATIINVIDFGMSAEEAVSAPRFHAQDREINIEPGIRENVRRRLRRMGHVITVSRTGKDEWWYPGAAQAVTLESSTGIMHGGADPRRDGEAKGY